MTDFFALYNVSNCLLRYIVFFPYVMLNGSYREGKGMWVTFTTNGSNYLVDMHTVLPTILMMRAIMCSTA